jgi:hypothetical protein
MGVFDNASAVAPFRAGYLVLAGMGTGKDSRHGLELLYGEVQSADQVPTFSSINFLEGQSSSPSSSSPSSSSPPPTSTSIVTPNGAYQHSIPYLFALDANTLVALYIGEENGQSALYAQVFYDDGATLTRVTALQQLATDVSAIDTAPIFGASTVPGLSGFVVAYNAAAAMNVLWCTLPAYTPGQAVQLSVQTIMSEALAVNPNIQLLIVVNGSGTGYASLRAVRSWNLGPVMQIDIFDVDISTGVPVLTQAASSSEDGQWPVFGLFRGADGLPWYQGVSEGSGVIAVGVVAADGSLAPAAGASMPSKLLPFPAPVYYTFGDFALNPEVGAREVVPVYRTFLFGGDSSNLTQVGQAQRTVFEQEPPATPQGVVIGIFDSGPPMPNENVFGIPPKTTLGTTTFGETQSNTSGWTINSSIGGFFQYSSSTGLPGILSVTQQFKISLGVNAAFSQQSTAQEITSYYASAQTTTYNDQVVINPQGHALVGTTSYIGYQFVFLDTTGTAVPNAPVYYELYPTGWTITALPFDYNPAATTGKVPGQLLTYVMDWDSEQALKQNLLNGASVAEVAWSTDGGASQATQAINQGSKSIGTNLSFEASIGGSIGPPDEQISVNAGLQASFAFTYTWSTSTSDQIQTVSTLGALSFPPPAGAFGSYTYDVLILGHSQQYTADLIALLQSYPSDFNTQLLAMIAPNSSPWQIVHIVRNYELAGSGLSAKPAVAAKQG